MLVLLLTDRVAASSPSDATQLTGLAGWVVDVVDALGPVGVGVLVALETVFPPIPSEVVLPVAGFLAGQGHMGLATTIVAATVGSVVGAIVLYAVGAKLGRPRLRRAVDAIPLVDRGDLERAESWFDKHGGMAVLTGRVIPVVRSLVSLPAGLERMSIPLFVALTALGSALYNSVLVGAGYLLGDRWTDVGEYSDLVNWVVIGAMVAALAWFVVGRLRRNRRAAAA